ncbi:MAG: ISAs1 family transposase [Kiritimatiellia bacterium]
MEVNTTNFAVLFEATAFLRHFEEMPDPRQRGKVVYPLNEILLLCLLAVIAGADCFTDIARFGRSKLALLRRFLPFENGTPAHDHLGDIFASLDAEAFRRCFAAWVTEATGCPADVVAIDGKTSRRSYQKKDAKEPIHMVSAFAARQRLVLGQIKVNEKSNEITAIPALIEMMEIEGAVVTIDAMGCQRAIAEQILKKKADYIFSLKGNQGTLCDDVKLFVAEQQARAFQDAKISRHETVDGDHGRIETRRYTVIHNMAWLKARHGWPGLRCVIVVETTREWRGKTERETRLYISSLDLAAESVAQMVRDHWSVENNLHWVMDMVFRDDECRVRKDQAPANFATIRHAAFNFLKRAPSKESMRGKRKRAGWEDDFLYSVVRP